MTRSPRYTLRLSAREAEMLWAAVLEGGAGILRAEMFQFREIRDFRTAEQKLARIIRAVREGEE